jgi:hypothetical protein
MKQTATENSVLTDKADFAEVKQHHEENYDGQGGDPRIRYFCRSEISRHQFVVAANSFARQECCSSASSWRRAVVVHLQ